MKCLACGGEVVIGRAVRQHVEDRTCKGCRLQWGFDWGQEWYWRGYGHDLMWVPEGCLLVMGDE